MNNSQAPNNPKSLKAFPDLLIMHFIFLQRQQQQLLKIFDFEMQICYQQTTYKQF